MEIVKEKMIKMGKSKIDGLGAKDKKTISLRAKANKLTVENKTCKFCGHHKIFIGNNNGQNIIKCCKCKKRLN